MENIVISGCNGTSSIFVINPTCTRERPRGTTRLTNVSFEDNGVFDQGHLIEANSSCLQLRMTAVLFVRNRCIGTNCILHDVFKKRAQELSHIQWRSKYNRFTLYWKRKKRVTCDQRSLHGRRCTPFGSFFYFRFQLNF